MATFTRTGHLNGGNAHTVCSILKIMTKLLRNGHSVKIRYKEIITRVKKSQPYSAALERDSEQSSSDRQLKTTQIDCNTLQRQHTL